ncbi:thiamine pyrophosphate-dependent enzyme [Dyella amyloliquefaciens]|uniref:thiamine pyrophosphate-dependent enzyme n=1 Tax=Dyella amyloliquefaciens TaxID=1770545 RepID=UPI00102EC09E|nr:thiamine pyrophosphate-dependent enzyme [Dyella amyloliquefaciens]
MNQPADTSPDQVPTGAIAVPQPHGRPGDEPDFSHLEFPPVGSARRPAVDESPAQMRELAYGLIRVLDADGAAGGEWNPSLSGETMRRALRAMVLTRTFDDRMFRAHRQGKTSFYMKCTGEEAIGCAQAMVLGKDDMFFPTYRVQGILITRDYPLVQMMNQIYSNASDPLQGRQLPILYSARDYGFFSLSGNVGTQYCQAVGWAMANTYKNNTNIASAFIGDGSTATYDFHHALNFAAVYRAPVILNITNNQWAISSFQGIAGGEQTTFAARGIGFGLPALRVDGNDFLAVYAATDWAAQRARKGLGATVIEFYTYRAEGHSTSDDPSKYRPKDEAAHWPMGDPIKRLKQHLIALGEWSEEQHAAMEAELFAQVRTAAREAEAVGTLGQSRPPVGKMFEQVFTAPDWRLERQRQEVEGQ